MHRWHAESSVCYAYLLDVDTINGFKGSCWFTRGWTVQELIAQQRVEFFTREWTYLGEKNDNNLLFIVSKANLVDACVLAGTVSLQSVSVASKMYWALRHQTTRKEDEAYCLLGLFGVNMPLLHGEGPKASIRLQQKIIKTTDDQSILAWYCVDDTDIESQTTVALEL
jgi:hypothetical protein